MSDTVIADDGVELPVEALPTTIGYAGGFPVTFTVVYRGNTYIQTMTYSGNNVIAISGWVKQ